MRPLHVALIALLAVPGTASALPAEDPLHDFEFVFHCVGVSYRRETSEEQPPHEPEPNPENRSEWRNATLRSDLGACMEPVSKVCHDAQIPCCQIPETEIPCNPGVLAAGLHGEKGIILPYGGGLCVRYDNTNVTVVTRECWHAAPP